MHRELAVRAFGWRRCSSRRTVASTAPLGFQKSIATILPCLSSPSTRACIDGDAACRLRCARSTRAFAAPWRRCRELAACARWLCFALRRAVWALPALVRSCRALCPKPVADFCCSCLAFCWDCATAPRASGDRSREAFDAGGGAVVDAAACRAGRAEPPGALAELAAGARRGEDCGGEATALELELSLAEECPRSATNHTATNRTTRGERDLEGARDLRHCPSFGISRAES